jgi:hypothetical protein
MLACFKSRDSLARVHLHGRRDADGIDVWIIEYFVVTGSAANVSMVAPFRERLFAQIANRRQLQFIRQVLRAVHEASPTPAANDSHSNW